jgi:hypothetical protein
MFSLSSSYTFLLYAQICDLRKNFDDLCGIATNELGGVAHIGEVFIFVNRKKESDQTHSLGSRWFWALSQALRRRNF